MLQPDKLKKLNENATKMSEQGSSKEDIIAMKDAFIQKFGQTELKKKEESQPATPTQKLALEPTVGSLGGKSTKLNKTGFPEIDTNSVAPGMGEQTIGIPKSAPQKQIKPKANKVTEAPKEYDFVDSLIDNFDLGLASLSKSFYDAPALVYDAAASVTNIIPKMLGYEEASSEKFAKTFGIRNVPSEVLKSKIDKTSSIIQEYNDKNGGDAFEAASNGNYLGAAKMVAGSTFQSLPLMISAFASGGSSLGMGLIVGSTASSKNTELKEENPEISVSTRVAKSAFSGLMEGFTGHLITGASGAVFKKIIADKGVEVGSKIISKSIKNTIENTIEKSPLTALVGEVAEESVVELSDQISDMASGHRTEFDYKKIANAGLSATGMGGVNTVAVYGAKAYVKGSDYRKVKSVNKQIDKLSTELNNQNLSDSDKTIISSRIERLVSDNKKIIGAGLEKLNALPTPIKEELVSIDSSISDLKNKLTDVEDNSEISEETKRELTQEIKQQGKELIERKHKVIEGSYIYDDFEKLPQEAKNRLKNEAGRVLLAEAQKNGETTASFDDAQLSKKASEIRNEELKAKIEPIVKQEQPVVEQTTTDTNEQVVEAEPAQSVSETKTTENETTQVEDIVDNGDVQLGASVLEQDGKQEISSEQNVQEPIDSGASEADAEVVSKPKTVKYKLTEKGQAFNGDIVYGKITFTREDGGKVSAPTRRALERKHASQLDFTQGKKATETDGFETTPENYNRDVASKSNNPAEIAEAIILEQFGKDKIADAETQKSAKENVIAEYIGKITEDSFIRFGDKNNLSFSPKAKKSYFSENGRKIDEVIEEMNETGLGITEQDVVDFITDYPNGKKQFYDNNKADVSQENVERQNGILDLKKKFEKLTGLPAKVEFLQKALAQENRKKNGNSTLDQLNDAELQAKYDELTQFENEQNGKGNETKSTTKGNNEVENTEGNGEKPSVQEVNNKPERKSATERIKIANAKIDDVRDAIKGIDNIFGIKIKVDDIDGLSQNGVDIVDVIAGIVKQAVAAGITVDDAISKTIEHLKKTIDFDVNIEDIKSRLKTDFESEQGKKSFLGRAATGNSKIIKEAIAKYSLDYEIENQKEAKVKAEAFVDEVGYDNALEAVRKGLVEGAQGAFIYAKAIEVLEGEINSLKGENRLDKIAEYQDLLGKISDELDNRSRSNGRFIAALAEIYNSSGGRYSLTKMVKDYKAKNEGKIDKEVLEKLRDVEQKLKEYEEKVADLEAKQKAEQEESAFNSIVESIARGKKINTSSKITNKQQAKDFADKLRSFKIHKNSNTSVATPISLAYDLAIETAAKIIETSGTIADAIKEGLKIIKNQNLFSQDLDQAVSDFLDVFDDTESGRGQMSVDKKGRLKIPHSLIRSKVEGGIDNIEDLTASLMEYAKELFPDSDFTEREVRDAITGYGKILENTQDDIENEISVMKSLGRIASGLQDAYNGKRPLRSGQQRRDTTPKERSEMKKLKALLRDLPLAADDIAKAYKTALDAIKSRLSNEIEELDIQIAKGEKRTGTKSVIKYDQEAKDLKAIRDSKRQELDDLVGRPELTDEQKIDRAEKILQKRLDDLKEQIDSNEIDYASKPEQVTSTKLEDMRKQKKEYEAQILQMRQDAGIAEVRLVEIARRNATKRLANLKERIANKDFAKKKRKPTINDVELNATRAEIVKQKEVFDKEVYLIELRNRTIEQKALDAARNIIAIPKVASFTWDLSFLGVQNVTQIYKMGSNSVVHLAKTGRLKGVFRRSLINTFKAMASPKFEENYMNAVRGNPNYNIMKEAKLGLVESHYKESAKAEVFQHNAISMVFDLIGNAVIAKGYEKTGNIIKDYVNTVAIFERGQTIFENEMRINRFTEGMNLLKAQGFNPIDDMHEYKKVAAAVNTLTGRANTGSKIASGLKEFNGTAFSSFSNWAAGVNQLNPYWYYTLTPTARKMALTDVAHHIIGAGAIVSMAALYALGQTGDEDEKDKVTVEYDPTSSDFALIKIGNLRFDPWAGKKTTVVAVARLCRGEIKRSSGEIQKYGLEYGDASWIDLPLDYAGNKLAPGVRFPMERFFQTQEVEFQGKTFRENKYGEDFKKSKYLIPLTFESFKEIDKEQPGLLGKVLMAVSWTGAGNTNVYGGYKEGVKGMPDDLIDEKLKISMQKTKDYLKKQDIKIKEFAESAIENNMSIKEIRKDKDNLFKDIVKEDPIPLSSSQKKLAYNDIYKKVKSIMDKDSDKKLIEAGVKDPFYLLMKNEQDNKIKANLFYSKFGDYKSQSPEKVKEINENLKLIGRPKSKSFWIEYRKLINNGKKKK